MIGILTGTIAYRDDPSIIIDVNGVGYKVLVPTTVLAQLTGLGGHIKVYTHTHVREDLLELYGFTSPEDLRLFEYLIGVSGVGCKTALGIFSVGSPKAIMQAIAGGDVAFFTAVPRLGKKNAQKIIIELKTKIGDSTDLDLSQDMSENNEVTAALKAFGFTGSEAQNAIRALKGEGKTIQEKIKLALKYLGK
jgi:Holliday junction DNA helicase RuvA